jgi:2-keto-4-pentenoate hydratase
LVSWHLAYELVTFTFADRSGLSGIDFFADNGCCAGMVVGPSVTTRDLETIAGKPVNLEIDGKVVIDTTVKLTKDQMVDRVTWLANHLVKRGSPLQAGQFVLTGNLTGMPEIFSGQCVVASIEGIGSIEARMPVAK